MGLFGGCNNNGNNNIIWIIVIAALLFFCCDGNLFGNNDCDNRCDSCDIC